MSCAEIRHWLKELHERHGWPWETLARTCGIGEGKHVVSKVRGNSSIYHAEQRRMSRQIDRIISGELVPSKPDKRGRVDAVLAAHPVSLERSMRMKVDLATGRLGFVERRAPTPGTVLSFSQGVEAFRT